MAPRISAPVLAICAFLAASPPSAADKGARYAGLVEAAAQRHGVSAKLIHAVIATESSYRVDAVSPKGAIGLMQLLPATARRYGVTDLLDPQQNIRAGTLHLRELLEAFDQDLALALAAYNAGRGAVLRYGGIPPFPETIRYVMRVLQRYGDVSASHYHFPLPANQQYTFSFPVARTATLVVLPAARANDATGGEQHAGWRNPRRSREAAHPNRRRSDDSARGAASDARRS